MQLGVFASSATAPATARPSQSSRVRVQAQHLADAAL